MAKMIQTQGRSHEDPLQEVAALQYLSQHGHPNVLQCTEVRPFSPFVFVGHSRSGLLVNSYASIDNRDRAAFFCGELLVFCTER